MVFSSSVFLFLFLPAILIVYSILPRTARNGVLSSDRCERSVMIRESERPDVSVCSMPTV